MDQALFIIAQIGSVSFTLTNIQAVGTGLGIIISTIVMWGLMTKNINERIKGKADEASTAVRFKSIESDITDIKDSAKADRALFIEAIYELRKDLRLKKDKP